MADAEQHSAKHISALQIIFFNSALLVAWCNKINSPLCEIHLHILSWELLNSI